MDAAVVLIMFAWYWLQWPQEIDGADLVLLFGSYFWIFP